MCRINVEPERLIEFIDTILYDEILFYKEQQQQQQKKVLNPLSCFHNMFTFPY